MPDPGALSVEGARRALHDLRVHQVELELQNDELRNAQVALDESRARYFDLYDLAPLGYLTLDDRGAIVEGNLRASELFAVPRRDLVGRRLVGFIASDDQRLYAACLEPLIAGGGSETCEVRVTSASADPRWIRLEAMASRDEATGVDRTRVMLSDITESRALRVSLARSQQMANLGLLAAGVAHEINNPLQYVLSRIESLEEALGGDAPLSDRSALRELAVQAGRGLERVAAITKRLGKVSASVSTALQRVDASAAAKQAIELTASEIKTRATLVQDLGQVPPVLASEGQLVQVILNLLINSTHALQGNKAREDRITVRVWADVAQVCVEVSDTGCGIPPADLDKVFDPFFTTKGPDRGTGLGLSVSRHMIAEFGGTLTINSKLGVGTQAVVRLPIAAGWAVEASESAAAEERSTAAPQPTPARARILVIDDDEDIRGTLAAMLARDHDVACAASGAAAKAILSDDVRFDLILCDVMMPNVSGVDVHRWLSERHPELAARIAFITGGVFAPPLEQYLAAIPNHRLQKPFRRRELLDLVEAMLIGPDR